MKAQVLRVLLRRAALFSMAICAVVLNMTCAIAQETIKLGAAISLSGRYSESAVFMREAYELWAEEVNAAGGIGGRKVQLTIYDDESNPDTARILVERLINRDGVTAILGPYSSPITDAIATACERAQIPLVAAIASDTSIWNRRTLKWTFQAFVGSETDHESFLRLAAQRSAKKVVIVFEETPFSISAKDWAVALAPSLGMSIETIGYAPASQDFRSIIERIVSANPDAVSLGGYSQPSIALTRQMIERGFNPKGYHFILAADTVVKSALGDNAEGIFGRSAWEPSIQTDISRRFVAAYKAKFGREPSYHAATAYAAAQLIGVGLKQSTDRNALRQFLATAKIPTVMGTYAVDERGRQTGYHYIGIQWQGGQRRIVWPAEIAESKVVWPKPAWK